MLRILATSIKFSKSSWLHLNKQCIMRYVYSITQIVYCSSVSQKMKSVLYQNIYAKIKTCGPISIADYMKEVLTHPTEGYYMSKDVFGQKGDFITSPEISQFFGEMIAVWILNEFQKISNESFQLVELGPGRGTLSKDVLRILHHLKVSDKVSLHLVEISPTLSKLQAKNLCIKYEEQTPDVSTIEKNAITYYMKGVTKEGIQVFWYYSIKDIPKHFSVFIAHEFFDALPIHKFQKSKSGWCEVLIDIDPTETEKERFRYVLTKTATPASTFYINSNEKRDHVEVSPQTIVTIDFIATFLSEYGGFALIIDYGHDGDKTDTFRAFRRHQQHDPLLEPGTADLTADIDFSMLKRIAQKDERVICFGPVKQNDFLEQMGIDLRLKILQKHASENEKQQILSAYHKIMDDHQMGSCFKALSLFPAVLTEHLRKWPVSGFQKRLSV